MNEQTAIDRKTTPTELLDDFPYTPQEVAQFYRVSTRFVQKQIQAGNLRAFRFGQRLLRIKGREAKAWVDALANISSVSSPGSTASHGGKKMMAANEAGAATGFRYRVAALKRKE